MKYAVFTDFARWDAVNRRPYEGRDTVTRQLVTVFKHPDRNEWLAAIALNSLAKVASYLTTQEQADLNALLSDDYPNDWPELDTLSPI